MLELHKLTNRGSGPAQPRKQNMKQKLLDIFTATAIGVGLAALLVAWWSA
jgi:hypothetical protein